MLDSVNSDYSELDAVHAQKSIRGDGSLDFPVKRNRDIGRTIVEAEPVQAHHSQGGPEVQVEGGGALVNVIVVSDNVGWDRDFQNLVVAQAR